MKKNAPPSEADLRAGHRKRLRERFLADPQALPDYELLELALGCVYLRRDNKILAKRLLEHFGSFGAVIAASSEELSAVEDCGPAVDSFLCLLREIIARSLQSNVQRKRSVHLTDLVEMGRQRLSNCLDEEVWAALLDNQNRLLIFKKIRRGSPNHVELEPRDVVELMVKYHATGVVLMHNHPGGTYTPSLEDKTLTEKLAQILQPLGLSLYDHVIITSEASYSMRHGYCIDVSKRDIWNMPERG